MGRNFKNEGEKVRLCQQNDSQYFPPLKLNLVLYERYLTDNKHYISLIFHSYCALSIQRE